MNADAHPNPKRKRGVDPSRERKLADNQSLERRRHDPSEPRP